MFDDVTRLLSLMRFLPECELFCRCFLNRGSLVENTGSAMTASASVPAYDQRGTFVELRMMMQTVK
jgi:hypothetical protein